MFMVSVVTIPAVQQRYRCGLCFTHNPRELEVTEGGYLALMEDGSLEVTLIERPEILFPPIIMDAQDSPPVITPLAKQAKSKGKR